MTKKVVVLGSTGSVGTAAIEVIEALPEQLSAYGMSAHRQWQQLIEQATALHPRWITVTDMDTAQQASSDCGGGAPYSPVLASGILRFRAVYA